MSASTDVIYLLSDICRLDDTTTVCDGSQMGLECDQIPLNSNSESTTDSEHSDDDEEEQEEHEGFT